MLRDKRIIIVLYSLEIGGAERQALLLGNHLLHEQGAKVEVWALCNPGPMVKLCEEYGIPWRIVPVGQSINRSAYFLKASLRLAWLLRQAEPNVILPYTVYPNALCGLGWRLTGAQLCIWNQRGGGVLRINPTLEHWAARLTPKFISNSQHGADFLVQTFKVNPTNIKIIYNGVKLAQPEADRMTWRSQLEVNDACFLACMIANLHSRKDHVTLLKAWKIVVDQLERIDRSAVLLLAGRFDATHKNLTTLAFDLKLGTKVRFLGEVKDISGLLNAVDLGILTSPYKDYEGCPNAVLEYMGCGLAVAGTDVSGIRQAVGPDGYPYLSPLGNTEALAGSILKLAMDHELRLKLGIANRKRVEMIYNPLQMCQKTVAFITHNLDSK